MRIHLVAFATASEALGGRRREIELPRGSSVRDLLALLGSEQPAFMPLLGRLAVAVDGKLVTETQKLSDGCEVALLPPVSGGRAGATGHFTREPIEIASLLRHIADPSCGAQVVFVGTVRASGQGKSVTHLTYEAYQPMAEEALALICREVASRQIRVAILHRLGNVELGEPSVVIACSAPHRGAAYEANREVLERLKGEVPIWKREHYADGSAEWREEEPLRTVGR